MPRSLPALLLLALALAAAPTRALDATVDALGDVQELIVGLAFNVSGTLSTTVCTDDQGDCLPQLQTAENKANSDTLIVTYAFNETFSNATSGVTGIDLRACFSAYSQEDRAWRKDKKPINPSMSNQCRRLINKDAALPPADGVFRWQLPNNVAPAVYFVRAYTVCGEDSDGNTQYCSWGESDGYFQVNKWNTTPAWLVATTIPLICTGPTLLAMYFGGHVIKRKLAGARA